jgi:hypothetical protein
MKARRADRSKYLALTPGSARVLSLISIGGMHLWFILKFFLEGTAPALQFVVGLTALVSIVGCTVVYVCTYNFVANAPSTLLDERELAERNAAYFRSFQYVCVLLLVGYIGTDVSARTIEPVISKQVIANYFVVAFFTSLIMPAAILAWKDRAPDEA